MFCERGRRRLKARHSVGQVSRCWGFLIFRFPFEQIRWHFYPLPVCGMNSLPFSSQPLRSIKSRRLTSTPRPYEKSSLLSSSSFKTLLLMTFPFIGKKNPSLKFNFITKISSLFAKLFFLCVSLCLSNNPRANSSIPRRWEIIKDHVINWQRHWKQPQRKRLVALTKSQCTVLFSPPSLEAYTSDISLLCNWTLWMGPDGRLLEKNHKKMRTTVLLRSELVYPQSEWVRCALIFSPSWIGDSHFLTLGKAWLRQLESKRAIITWNKWPCVTFSDALMFFS